MKIDTRKKFLTQITPKVFSENEISGRKRIHKVGFTIIELIVVMAVLAILVMLAAPKLLGRTREAMITKYTSDAKVISNAVDNFLVHNHSLDGYLELKNIETIKQTAEGENIVGIEGIVTDAQIHDGQYYELTYEFVRDYLDIKISKTHETFITAEAFKGLPAIYASNKSDVFIDLSRPIKKIEVGEGNDGGNEENPKEPDEPVVDITEDTSHLYENQTPTPGGYFTFDTATNSLLKFYQKGVNGDLPEIFDVVIPKTIDGVEVKNIKSSFIRSYDVNNLKSIYIPDTVVNVANATIDGLTIDKIVVPNSLNNSTNFSAFRGVRVGTLYIYETPTPGPWTNVFTQGVSDSSVSHYEHVVLLKGVTDIPANAFYYGNVGKVSLPNTLLTVGADAFGWGKLTSVEIPDSVTSLGTRAFFKNQISNIKLGQGLKSIGNQAFSSNQLTNLDFLNGSAVTTIETAAFASNLIDKIIIPNEIKSIGTSAFQANPSTELFVPEGVTLESRAFSHLVNLQTVRIPSSLRSGTTVMFDSSAIENLIIYKGVGDDDLYNVFYKDNLSRIDYINNVHFEDGIRAVKANTFKGIGVKTVTFNNDIEIIEADAFYGNEITQLILPDSLHTMGIRAFSLNKLTDIKLGSSLKVIPTQAFANNLVTNLDFLAGTQVNEIQASAFYRNFITKITLPDTIVKIGTSAFGYNPVTELIISNEPTLAADAFSNLANLQTVRIPSSLKSPGGAIFKSSKIENLTIYKGAGADSLVNVFYRTTTDKIDYVRNVTFEDGVKVITANSFYGVGVNSVTLNNDLNLIESQAFRNNTLKDVIIPGEVTGIGANAFHTNLITTVQLPASLQTIGLDAFRNNGPLKNSPSITVLGTKTWVYNGTLWE